MKKRFRIYCRMIAVLLAALLMLTPSGSAFAAVDEMTAPIAEEVPSIEDMKPSETADPTDSAEDAGRTDAVVTDAPVAAEEEEEPEPYLGKTEKETYIGRTFRLKLWNARKNKVKWYSSKDSVATVEDGLVTAVGAGKARITAKYQGVKYVCQVTVKAPVKNAESKRIRINQTFQYKVKGANIVSYKSSKKKVASVDENGLITANKKGQAVITATDVLGNTYDCSVTVYQTVLDIENPSFADLAPTTRMSFEELVGNNGNYDFPKGYPKAGTYKVIIDLHYKVVLVYAKDDAGKYTKPVRYMLCSVGADETQTPTGTFKMQAFRVRNSIFNNTTSYAQYWSEIVGRIYFHSILYSSLKAHDYTTTSWNNLGSAVSHGCVRLTVPDARWIWYNIAPGTTVVIREGSSSDKETAAIRKQLVLPKLPSNRPALKEGDIPYTDNWLVEDVPNEVKFVQGSQNGGEAAY